MKTFSDFAIDTQGKQGEIKTLCPQCSHTRKKSGEKCLSVNTEKGAWFCQHCGYAGGLGEGKAEKKYTQPDYTANIDLPGKVVDWFSERGISKATLKLNQVGYGKIWMPSANAEVNAIQFPYLKNRKVVNIKYRDGFKNFRQAKDAEKCLYRFDAINASKSDTMVITEGEIDALSFHEAGFNAVCSIPDGAPAANANSYHNKFDFLRPAEEAIKRHAKVILATDADVPGQKAEIELARRIGAEKCYRVHYPTGCKDANEVLVKHGKTGVSDLIKNASPYPIKGVFSPLDLKAEVLNLYEKGPNRGVSTGWRNVDEFYTVKTGEMTVVTGIPGAGKSNVVDAIMVNLMQSHDWAFAVFSPENWPVERHLQTLLEKVMRQPFARPGQYAYKRESPLMRMSRDQVEDGLDLINKYFHFIVPADEIASVDVILAKAKLAVCRHGIKGLVIDPWNEIEHDFGNLREDQYISMQLTKIRRFARLNGVHVWVIAHPKNLRKDENGAYQPPSMYEISGGAHWRNKADNGICVHRPDFKSSVTEFYIQKIRFREVGKLGMANLIFIMDTGRYEVMEGK